MERPDINLILESIEYLDARTLKGTIIHLIEYILHIEKKESK